MKIINPLSFIPKNADTGQAGRRPEAAEPFQTFLKQRCQELGAPAPGMEPAMEPAMGPIMDLAGSTLDLLERIAAQMADGASARQMATSHVQLGRQAVRLRQAASGLEEGPLKDIVDETAALSYLQLWRFEQGELL